MSKLMRTLKYCPLLQLNNFEYQTKLASKTVARQHALVANWTPITVPTLACSSYVLPANQT